MRRFQSSEPLHTKWIQPPACWDHGLFRILSSYWLSQFYLLKILQKWCSILVWIADCWFSPIILLTCRNPKNNCWLSHIFGARFGKKDCGLCTNNPWSQQRGWLEAFFVWSGSKLWSFFKYSKLKFKNTKPIAVVGILPNNFFLSNHDGSKWFTREEAVCFLVSLFLSGLFISFLCGVLLLDLF